MNLTKPLLVAGLLSLNLAGSALAAVDDEAAKALGKRNDCFKCHAVDKAKKGPSYQKIAAKYKGKADAEEKLMKNLTTGPKVKLEDGTEEEHKIIDTKDPKELKNLIDWILSR
ncbi:MAG: c-type cytochrome [Propionivibrio sp.]|uniref:c-type cytochrome n=1 Tax=Propionivibrio sp. TaxID=2212460 RepID=UPI001A41A0A0|nr:c-type cytochrome [Propionivibrio sp.]MBL8414611.1 c-type cytochrome [Propionivibrio sp.]